MRKQIVLSLELIGQFISRISIKPEIDIELTRMMKLYSESVSSLRRPFYRVCVPVVRNCWIWVVREREEDGRSGTWSMGGSSGSKIGKSYLEFRYRRF